MNLINDIICIAKIEAGVLDVNKEPFSLNHMMCELKEVFEFEVENSYKSGLRVEFEFGCEDDDLQIESDSERIKQIIINLFTNAFKFTDSGFIKVGYALYDDIVSFYVQDTGIGIPESDFELIFMRFKQSHLNNNSNPEGTGIGLTISKTLSALLGAKYGWSRK
jgi:signal transduction histidine kinase